MPKELPTFHDPHFDPLVHEAHAFTNQQLGLTTSTIEQVTVVHSDMVEEVKELLGAIVPMGGSFDDKTGEIVTVAKADPANPAGAAAQHGSAIVHELTHSGTANLDHHIFYNEALAGMGEAKYLQWLAKQGRWQRPANFTLARAGVQLRLLGSLRYYDTVNTNTGKRKASTSQGLIAAMGVGIGMYATGTKVADVMTASSRNGEEQFELMQQSLDALQSGLSTELANLPETIDGIVQATHAIQEVARNKGILKL